MIKKCKHCGKNFETNNPQKIYCDDIHYRPCPVCGKLVSMIDNDFNRPPRCCSKECGAVLRKQKFKERMCVECGQPFHPSSGVQRVCNRSHTRICEICGQEFQVSRRNIHDNVTACSKECKRILRRKHNIEKWGVYTPMLRTDIQDKYRHTMLARYGVEYGVQLECAINHQGSIISKTNRDFGNKLERAGVEYKFEFRISKYSYDIHILNTNILIEIDPTYTHNLIGNHWSDGIECGYHLEKTLLAIQNGYRVIHVFDWDDWDKIVNMLRDKKSVYARKCKLYKISTSVANEFLDKYHLQGKCRGQLLCLGLYYNNELVQVMTFGKSRYDKKHDVELLRLCSHPEYRIVGGASKMFKFATAYYGLSNIISYCDVSKFTGEVYEAIGMKKVRTTPPQEVWSDGMSKITANLLRQQGFDRLFGANFGKGANNEILMIEHGWLPIEDCGQYVYEYIG